MIDGRWVAAACVCMKGVAAPASSSCHTSLRRPPQRNSPICKTNNAPINPNRNRNPQSHIKLILNAHQTHPNQPQVTDIIAEGYPAQQVLLQLQAATLAAPSDPAATDAAGRDASIGTRARARICEVLAEADKALQDGADEFLQLLNAGAQIQKVLAG